jgi:hypothetical protein
MQYLIFFQNLSTVHIAVYHTQKWASSNVNCVSFGSMESGLAGQIAQDLAVQPVARC